MEAVQLAALMMSRLCHDLASPVTAIAYGSELLDEDSPQMRVMAKQQIEAGTRSTINRLAFFRYAFGTPQTGMADMHEAAKLIEEYCSIVNIRIRHELQASQQEARRSQLLLNMLLLAAERLPRGGELRIMFAPLAPDGAAIAIEGVGERIIVPEYLEPALGGMEPEKGWSASSIQPFFASLIARELALSLSVSRSEQDFMLKADAI